MDKNTSNLFYEWDKTREAYTDWVASTPLREIFAKHLTWQGMSLWWAANPTQKDTFTDPRWYQSLNNLVNNKGKTNYHLRKESRIKLFLRDMYIWLIIRLSFSTRKQNLGPHVWFHGLDYNLRVDGSICVDRLYIAAPLKDHDYNSAAAYLVKISASREAICNPIRWKINKIAFLDKLKRPYWICDEYLRFTDVIEIHAKVFWYWLKLRWFFLFAEKNKYFAVDNKNATSILWPFLESSFYGPIQASLLYAKSMERFFKYLKSPQIIVNYGELLPQFRAVYHSIHSLNFGHRFFAVQHALNNRNKLFCYHRKSEFSVTGTGNGLLESPMPDIYLVQGQQFKDILSGYYQESRIYTIGCLKYDSFITMLQSKEENRNRVFEKIGRENRKVILLAPSIGDEDEIFHLMKDFKDFGEWRVILSPHPITRDYTLNKLKKNIDLKDRIEIFDNLRTNELIQVADLVVCGYSSSGLESAIFGVQAVRGFIGILPPKIEDEEGVPVFSSCDSFHLWRRNFYSGQSVGKNSLFVSDLAEHYFHKIDGHSSDRLWEALTYEF